MRFVNTTLFAPTRRYRQFTGDRIDGSMLIGLGSILLLQKMIGFSLHPWWVLVILLLAVGGFAATWANYQAAGRATSAVCAAVVGRIVLGLVAVTFLFDLSWVIVGPVLIVTTGAAWVLSGVVSQ